MNKKVMEVRQFKSANGCTQGQKACVRGLGLRRLNQTVWVEDTRATRGMVYKVNHLVEIVRSGNAVVLFDDKERSDLDSRKRTETDYEYLDRSGRPEAKNVRDFLNYWLLKLPAKDASDLVGRMRSRKQQQFDSATFEIILYAILKGIGCDVEVHPQLSNDSTNKPDFLVILPNGDRFYLEAVLASELSNADLGAEKRRLVVLDAIDNLDSPNFFVSFHAHGNPDTPPSSKSLKRELAKWLENLDPDVVIAEIEEFGSDSLPRYTWESEGWLVEFYALPKKPDRRGKGQRTVGLESKSPQWTNIWEPIRDAIKYKGGRYGELEIPFVVAVNVHDHPLDKIDEKQALFGQEQFIVSTQSLDSDPKLQRARNGAWVGPSGPQYRRVSGAWLFGGVDPWNIVSRKNTLYFNPWALQNLSQSMRIVHHAVFNGGVVEWGEGKSLAELLHLPEAWPEQQ